MEKIVKRIKNTRKLINSIDFDAHWYRRVFHSFGASFLLYYMLPDLGWINLLKLIIPLIILLVAISIEILRLRGIIPSDHFFGLRMYEKKRVGSYLYFAIAIVILLTFFPQQIAVPCILCACIADPLIGEIRIRFKKDFSYILGFLICMLFFMIAWFKADIYLMLAVSIVGGLGAIIGEAKKIWWLDDDFSIQILPAILLSIIWIAIPYIGLSYPGQIIYPGLMPW